MRLIAPGVNLSGANLRFVDLSHADLKDVNLSNADLKFANLKDVNLSNADLRGADLRGAENLTREQVKSAKNWDKAIYDEEFRKQLGLK